MRGAAQAAQRLDPSMRGNACGQRRQTATALPWRTVFLQQDPALELDGALAGLHVFAAGQITAAGGLEVTAGAAGDVEGGAVEDELAAFAGGHELAAVLGIDLLAAQRGDHEQAVAEVERGAVRGDAVVGDEAELAQRRARTVTEDGAAEFRRTAQRRADQLLQHAVDLEILIGLLGCAGGCAQGGRDQCRGEGDTQGGLNMLTPRNVKTRVARI